MKTRVLTVATSMDELGGVSIQAKRLLDTFTGEDAIEMKFLPSNPRFSGPLEVLHKIKYLRTIATSLKFWWLLLRNVGKNDIVQVFSVAMTGYIFATIPPLIFAKLFRRKTILNYHSGELEEHLKRWKWLALPTMRMFDVIIVPSEFLVGVFSKYGLSAEAIPNFVNTEDFHFSERKTLRPIFLSNRNFEFYYNVSVILRAFAEIQSAIPEAELIIAGYGSEENTLKKLAGDLHLKNVEFVGKVSQKEMSKLYDRADIYLNSSIIDNMPLSIAEAFSCGLPVVSTNPGGIPFMVRHGETGLLVEINDHSALASEAIKLLDDGELAQRIIKNARNEALRFSFETIKTSWTASYRKLVVLK